MTDNNLRDNNGMLKSEMPEAGLETGDLNIKLENETEGITFDGLVWHSIVRMKDGSLMTGEGQQSMDEGRTWSKSKTFKSCVIKLKETPDITRVGMLRLPNNELGFYYADKWTMTTALGNDTNNWFFCWSSDEGKSWSEPVQITLPGLTMGLFDTMFALSNGRLILVTYTQLLGSRFDKRGQTYGTYKGVRIATETEGHYPQFEAGRVYYSDDNGRCWKACDGWIIGWRDDKWSDLFTEPCGVELKDGRIMLVGRTAIGRLSQAFSEDQGHSWWPGAQPMELMSSYSPARIGRIPSTGDLLIVWNQVSRAEIRKGFRRSRLSSAISKDEGKTWGHFKNIEAIKSLAPISQVPPDPDLTPVWADPEIGQLPDDFGIFHYHNIVFIHDEVFIGYPVTTGYNIVSDENGQPETKPISHRRTKIIPVKWFYK